MPKDKSDKSGKARTDWARVDALTDAEIERMATGDKENPSTTGADWVDAVVGLPPPKTPVNAKFDSDIVDWFKSQGRGYQSRMNAVLRSFMQAKRKAG